MNEAKTNLPRLVDEEFPIASTGVPVAQVTSIKSVRNARSGFHPGTSVPEDFDSMFENEFADSPRQPR